MNEITLKFQSSNGNSFEFVAKGDSPGEALLLAFSRLGQFIDRQRAKEKARAAGHKAAETRRRNRRAK
jgi:hypothetical protein